MIKNTGMFTLKKFLDKGRIGSDRRREGCPFPIKRIYYISNVQEGVRRGFHSHRDLHQALICVHGICKNIGKNTV